MRRQDVNKALVVACAVVMLTGCGRSTSMVKVEPTASRVEVSTMVPTEETTSIVNMTEEETTSTVAETEEVTSSTEETTEEETTSTAAEETEEEITSTSTAKETTEETTSTTEKTEEATSTTAETEEVTSTTEETTEETTSTVVEVEETEEITTMAIKDDKDYHKYGKVTTDKWEGITYFEMQEDAPAWAWTAALKNETLPVGCRVRSLLEKVQYKGHTIVVKVGTNMSDIEDVRLKNGAYFGVTFLDEENNPVDCFEDFIYDIDGNIVCYVPGGDIVDEEVRDGKKWYLYEEMSDMQYWIPEHNIMEYADIFAEYVEAYYKTGIEAVEDYLKMCEHVWNRTYYSFIYDPVVGRGNIFEDYAYLHEDGTIEADFGMSEDFHNKLISLEDFSAMYWDYVEKYGQSCVSWGREELYNHVDFTGHSHDFDVWGSPDQRCKSLEEHMNKK